MERYNVLIFITSHSNYFLWPFTLYLHYERIFALAAEYQRSIARG